MSAAYLLHKAALAKLQQSAALTATLGAGRIFDAVPYNQPFPFAVIGEMTSTDWSTGTEQGAEHSLVLHIWSRSGGKKQTFEAASAIFDALHEAAFPLEGHGLVNLRHQSTDVRRAEDGETFHGVMRFRAVTEPLA
jgi:hypothetical protein